MNHWRLLPIEPYNGYIPDLELLLSVSEDNDITSVKVGSIDSDETTSTG
jgi:hypothetical protein